MPETQEQQEQEQQEQEQQELLFNPFTVLHTDDGANEIAALAGRFNASWKAQRTERINVLVTEYNCSAIEACFAVWLQDDATAIIRRERIRKVAMSIQNMLDETIGKDAEIALLKIEDEYSKVPATDRVDVGRRVRSFAKDKFTGKIGEMILQIVYKRLGVKESEWMPL